MPEKLFTAVVLDVPRRIRFSNRAVLRQQQLENPLGLEEITKKKRAHAALIQWLWACLIDEDAKAFASPEDLAEVLPFPLPIERRVEMQGALLQAWEIANPSAEKKAASSAPSPSPASNSD